MVENLEETASGGRGDWTEYRRAVMDAIRRLADEAKERRSELLGELSRLEVRLSEQLRLAEGRLERRVSEAAEALGISHEHAEAEREQDKASLERKVERVDELAHRLERQVSVLRARAAILGSGFGAVVGAIAGGLVSRLIR